MDSFEERQKLILAGVEAKKRSIRRKWMEINSLANAHTLILLPYHAMLSHVGQLIAERQIDLTTTTDGNCNDNDRIAPMNFTTCSCIDTYSADADDEDEEYMDVVNTLQPQQPYSRS